MTPTKEQIKAEIGKANSVKIWLMGGDQEGIAEAIAIARLEAREKALDEALAIIEEWESKAALVYRLIEELKGP